MDSERDKNSPAEVTGQEQKAQKAQKVQREQRAHEVDLGPSVPSPEDKEVTCPSCFRFVGTYEKCPYCGAAVYKRLSVRLFRWGSLVLAFVGLGLLWMAARGIDAPMMNIHELEPTMSMGLVKVAGRVENRPRLHPEWKSLYMKLDDGTGELAVKAYSEVATVIAEQDMPRRGDSIAVEGMIRFKSGGSAPTMLIQAPQHLEYIKKVARPSDAKEYPIAEVTEDMEGRFVVVKGELISWELLSFGAYSGTLRDETGELILWLKDYRWKQLSDDTKALLQKEGAKLKVRGRVKLFYNKKEEKNIVEVVPVEQEDAVLAIQ